MFCLVPRPFGTLYYNESTREKVETNKVRVSDLILCEDDFKTSINNTSDGRFAGRHAHDNSERTFKLFSVDFGHASAAIALLTIHRNLDASSSGHDGNLLTHHGTLHRLAIDGDIVVDFGTILEAGILARSERLVVGKGALETTEKVQPSRR